MHLCPASFRRALFLVLLCALGAFSATITVTVSDPSGAVVPAAKVEIEGPVAGQKANLSSSAPGQFISTDLKAGTYTVRVAATGFEPFAKLVEVGDAPRTLAVKLELAAEREEITVGGTNQYANSDPVYRQLRAIPLGKTFALSKFTVEVDAATFQFNSGTLTFLAPVQGHSSGAVFIGSGHFSLKAWDYIDKNELQRRTHDNTVEEEFNEIVFRFTNNANQQLLHGVTGEAIANPPEATAALERWEQRVRHRREFPTSLSEYLLAGSEMDNVDAEILASLYNPHHPVFFSAYIHGTKHKDLRFFLRERGGALTELFSAEEVALVNYDPLSLDDGVWYSSHLGSEFAKHQASSDEERRYVAARKFKIETVIGNNDHLTSVATVTFVPLVADERVIRFNLLPNLRVSRVSGADGKDLYFIQESRKADGSFYVILNSPAQKDSESFLTIEYSGDKVITKAGNGSFYIGAREAWYPALNPFADRAYYDLTFKVPKHYRVISVGALDKEWVEDKFSVSHWVSAQPLAVAGFNYGDYKKTEIADPITGYKIEGYYLPDPPDFLRGVEGFAPGAMTKGVLEQARAQLELCTFYFGKGPYDRLYITEQPNFNFGQSWPNLVYLPAMAYLDSTQRWLLFHQISNSAQAFVDEVTPHEVAHQWWGHAVSWASYHDQWLSEGFAEFSAALFTQQAVAGDQRKDYLEFWTRLRKKILDKNNFGVSPNDAGPLWLGERLNTPRNEQAYFNITYPKGAYVLGMLRSLMYSNQDKDKAFIDMMHDFVDSHKEHPASTESFKVVAEKHMTNAMDLERNHRLDWFFREWVYGTMIPHYELAYQTSPGEGGKTKVHISITESGVDDTFAMIVPLFGDFGKGMVRLGQLAAVGNSTRTYDIELPAEPKKLVLNAYKEILER